MKTTIRRFYSLLIFLVASLCSLFAETTLNSLENIKAENYCTFLNAVEPSDTHGFYHPEMASDQIVRSLAEDGIHFTYSLINDCGEFPVLHISQSDALCFLNWLDHGCPTDDAVTDEMLFTPLTPNMEACSDGLSTSSLTPVVNGAAPLQENHEQIYKNSKVSYSSYFYDALKAISSATEWSFWNVGGEVVEAIVFQQVGLYALLPYCAYMGAVIFHEYIYQEYYEAAGTILHALFDIACMLGGRIGFDVAEILGAALEKCGLKCIADFFGTIHAQIDYFLHALGIEHSHGIAVEETAAALPLRQEIANELALPSKKIGTAKHSGCANKNCRNSHQGFDLDAAYWNQFSTTSDI